MNENRIDEPTTTHAAWGAGHPRLMVSSGDTRFVHEITTDRVRVGSSAENELVLRGCDPLHAEIEHDPRDEYVLTMHGAGEMNAKPVSMAAHPGERAEILRTGARFTAGPWTLVYMRDEFADHGRPFGGRQGGEFAHQRRQPVRPDYQHPGDVDPPQIVEQE